MPLTITHSPHGEEPVPLFDYESIVPVILGMIISAVLCLVVGPTSAKVLLNGKFLVPAVAGEEELPRDENREEEKQPTPVSLGDDVPHIAQLAWIAYDDYRALMAPTAETIQPSLQQMVDPVKDAPHRTDASPPTSQIAEMMPGQPRQDAERESPPDTPVVRKVELEESPSASAKLLRRPPALLLELERTDEGRLAKVVRRPEPVEVPGPEKLEGFREQKPIEKNQEMLPAKTPPAIPVPPKGTKKVILTASPRSDREAPPVDIKPDIAQVRAGRVLTAQGIKIKTAVPKISIQATLTALRGGIRVPVSVTFDAKGRAVRAELKGRSGYPEIDSPIRSSLYQWSASGRKLATMTDPFTVTIDIIISGQI